VELGSKAMPTVIRKVVHIPAKEFIGIKRRVVEEENSGLFFIDGPGGTGKTVENLLLANTRSSGAIALSVASSGIAAILLDGGRTSHSRLKIPIEIHFESICPISAQSDLAALLRRTSLIIWDEAPAQHCHCFEAIDRITVVFAGTGPFTSILHLTNIFFIVGDFRQCLPVVPKGTQAQIVASTIAYAPFWKDVKVMPLKVNMRVLGQAAIMTPEEHVYATQFALWQLKVGDGSTNNDWISIRLPPTNVLFSQLLLIVYQSFVCQTQMMTNSSIRSTPILTISMTFQKE